MAGGYVEFDLIEVARRCNIKLLKQLRDGQWLARCPFCGDSVKSEKHGHLYLKQATGDYACHRCGKMGKTVGMYASLRNIDTKSAYRELVNAEALPEIRLKPNNIPAAEEPTAPLQRRHEVYSAMLDNLQLKTIHRTNLLKRGLTNEHIIRNGYKSYPVNKKERAALCEKLTRKYNLSRVPGFFINEDGEWDIVPCPNGYLLPMRSVDSKIQGIQLRVFPHRKGSKYLWLSSTGRPEGAKSGQFLHLAVPPGTRLSNRIWLTEGSLKADIAAYFTKAPFLATAGVNATRGMVETLKNLNIGEVVIAYDMDRGNLHVKKALESLENDLQSARIVVQRATWPVSLRNGEIYPKGIDDACLERKKKSLEVNEDAFITFSKTVTKKVTTEESKVTVEETVKYEIKGPPSARFFEKARELVKKIF